MKTFSVDVYIDGEFLRCDDVATHGNVLDAAEAAQYWAALDFPAAKVTTEATKLLV